MKHFFLIIGFFSTLILLSDDLRTYSHQDSELTTNLFIDFEDESNNCNDEESNITNIALDSVFYFKTILEKRNIFHFPFKDKISNTFIRIEVPPPNIFFSYFI